MKARGNLFVPWSGLLVIVACSSSSPSGGSSAPSGCTCDVSYNGATRTISCGSDTCLNSVSFQCGSNADVTQRGACTGAAGAEGGAPDSGGASYQPGQCSQTTDGTAISVSGQCEYCV